jgi:methylphosphotriester-DNA--protein-cysteine methyltransferase
MKKLSIPFLVFIFLVSVFSVALIKADNSTPVDEKKVNKKVLDTHVYIKEGGKKYHRKNCSLVKTGKTQVTLEEALAKGYTPCKICIKVYVNENGKKYHRKGCNMIGENAVEMSIPDALEKEYTPCKVCHPEVKEKKQ